MKSSITQLLRYQIVEDIKNDMFAADANTYVCIGRPLRWGNDSNETASEIEDIAYSVDYANQLFRDMVAMKKIQAADLSLVVPRVDWTSGTYYDQYDHTIDLYSHNSTNVFSTGTTAVGAYYVKLVTGTTTSLSVGDKITIGTDTKEIVTINSAVGPWNGGAPTSNYFCVNTAFTTAYVANSVAKISSYYPNYSVNFYVRNSKDQIFKCLYNNKGAASTIEPTIDIDGQLPENPYIEPGDGYKWKYMYTIPYGLKQKFFTKNWMPVSTDATVLAGSVDGRIDIINILNGGTGYYSDGQSGTSSSLGIVSIVGDGFGANVTAKVVGGVITDLNILNGGSNYTTASVVISDPDQLASGNAASFDVVIGPQNGHGYNPAKELGCSSVMVSVEISATENGKVPVTGVSGNFDYRQIVLVRDPRYANNSYAAGSVYSTTTKLSISSPGTNDFTNDEIINGPNGTATVVYWDRTTYVLYVNNITGTISAGEQINGGTTGATATILSSTGSEIDPFTGDVLYIENRAKITRDVDQTEQIRLTLSF